LKNTLLPIIVYLFIITLFATSCGTAYQIPKNQTDNSHIYRLPFKNSTSKYIIQSYNSRFSHKNNLAIDFKVKTGTVICAARGGVVTAVRDDSNKRGMKPENLADWNYIFITHEDGSEAWYGHLKQNSAKVKLGDAVTVGQQIAQAGNTGWSMFPHLHFEVHDENGAEIPVRFNTKKGVCYLKAGRFYGVRE
jgi:murein DD-endopeptidase MepM/ murein hydrolase activator NlpD